MRAKVLTYVNEGPGGKRVLKLDDCVTDSNPYLIQHFKTAPVQPDQCGILNFRANVPAGRHFTALLQCEKPGKYLGGPSRLFTGKGKWAEYSCRFTDIPAGTVRIGLGLAPYILAPDNALTGSMLLDNVSFEITILPQSKFGKLKITSRDLCIDTALVKDGKAAAAIVGDAALAAPVIAAVKAKTGVALPIVNTDPGKGNLITIGSRDRNDFVSTLYNRHYTLLDTKYPGKGGSEVRSLQNPGDKRNSILCGGSEGTVEVMDADGRFLKRRYTQYGPVDLLVMQSKPARLWCLRSHGGVPVSHMLLPDLTVKELYNTLDIRNTPMNFDSGIGRTNMILRGDRFYGDLTGQQNHVMLWDNAGKLLAEAELGSDNAAGSGFYGSMTPQFRHLKHLAVLQDGTVTALTRRARAFFWTPELKLKRMLILPAIPSCGADDSKTVFAGFTDGTIRRIVPDGSITLLGRMPGTVKTLPVTDGKLFAGNERENVAAFRY